MGLPGDTIRKLDDLASLMAFDEQLEGELNTLWLLIGAILVFFMQTGFAMVEVGSVGTKNTRSILLKNVLDAALGAIFFGSIGYGFAYGDTGGTGFLYGVIGKDHFLLKQDDFGAEDTYGYGYAFWLFQWAFAATAATIVSGAVCERVTFTAYFIYTCAIVLLIYPVVACLVWNPQGLLSAFRVKGDRVFGCGVQDFAGSGVVHVTGGMAALVGAAILGPRRAFLVNELKVPEYGAIFHTLGTLILWFGWYGFNAVSTLYLVGSTDVAAKVMVSTTVAAAGGCLSTLLFASLWEGFDTRTSKLSLKLEHANNGVLSGLVAITSGCAVMEPLGAAVAGVCAGPTYVLSAWALKEWGVDDVVGAFPVHGACGALGLLLPGVLGTQANYAAAFSSSKAGQCSGVLYGGDGSQLMANILGLAVIVGWSGGASAVVFSLLRSWNLLRLSEEREDEGMDDNEDESSGVELARSSPPMGIAELEAAAGGGGGGTASASKRKKNKAAAEGKSESEASESSSLSGGRGGGGRSGGGGGRGGGSGRGKTPKSGMLGAKREANFGKNSDEDTL